MAAGRLVTGMLAAFAVILAAVNIVGAVSAECLAALNQLRLHLALGASPVRMVFRTMRRGLVVVLVGIGGGRGGVILANGMLRSFLGGVDLSALPLTVASAGFVMAVGTAALTLPALRVSSAFPAGPP